MGQSNDCPNHTKGQNLDVAEGRSRRQATLSQRAARRIGERRYVRFVLTDDRLYLSNQPQSDVRSAEARWLLLGSLSGGLHQHSLKALKLARAPSLRPPLPAHHRLLSLPGFD